MEYLDLAAFAGYTPKGGYSHELLEEIGMAVERAQTDWGYYEAGLTDTRQYNDVLAVFSCRDEAPSEEATVAAYAEGMSCA